jgi:hypothetical protein
VPTSTFDITANADDGDWTTGIAFDATGNNVTLNKGAADTNAFLRFQAISIAKYSIISAATLTVTSDGNNAGTISVTIKAAAADDASAPTTFGNAASATRTTASTTWALPTFATSTAYISDDFRAVIQEVINRSGWASGNDMVLFLDVSSGTNGVTRTFHSKDSGNTVARLTVTYTEGDPEDVEQKFSLKQSAQTPMSTLLSKQHSKR